jgi:hypothetical protein
MRARFVAATRPFLKLFLALLITALNTGSDCREKFLRLDR